ncbi:MAG TPA: Arc family DNA-binding protein [Candidatus Methylomirabilis sp.]|nr:Arc family DNA-binding protein [Candidatus Methylomirabilis sp.]
MATLFVWDMPNELYEQLKKRAAKEGRSISEEAIRLLRRVLFADRPKPDPEFKAWLDRVTEQRERWARVGRKFPDSTTIIREDRDR